MERQLAAVRFGPTSTLLDEILLHVVTVNLGAAEDDGLVHLVLFDGSHCVLALQHLDGFGPHFFKKKGKKLRRVYLRILSKDCDLTLLSALTCRIGSGSGVVFGVDFIRLYRTKH